MIILVRLMETFLSTLTDVLPITVTIFAFQAAIIRRPIPHLRQVLAGFAYVVFGMTLFLVGLEEALFPIGKLMAQQLTAPEFIGLANSADWRSYLWVYLFAAMIGFATTIAEPALMAVALKANQVSGGSIGTGSLRIAVGIGVGIGLAVGTLRIVTGVPLYYLIIIGYLVVIAQTVFAPKQIIALAYDTGGVTTSTITVPIVTALGLGLASNVPERSPLLDGFGLIAFASLFPIISVLAYAQFAEWRSK